MSIYFISSRTWRKSAKIGELGKFAVKFGVLWVNLVSVNCELLKLIHRTAEKWRNFDGKKFTWEKFFFIKIWAEKLPVNVNHGAKFHQSMTESRRKFVAKFPNWWKKISSFHFLTLLTAPITNFFFFLLNTFSLSLSVSLSHSFSHHEFYFILFSPIHCEKNINFYKYEKIVDKMCRCCWLWLRWETEFVYFVVPVLSCRKKLEKSLFKNNEVNEDFV